MFLTAEQMEKLDEYCEKVAGERTRSGSVTIVIRNNMPRTFEVVMPIFDEDHVLVGEAKVIHRVPLPEGEVQKGRQRNRLPGKKNGQ